GLRIQRGETITALAKEDNHWRLQSSTGRNPDRFDWVILTAPASQTAALAEAAPTLRALCAAREMKSCVALMLGFDKAPCLPWQAALVRNADISWISVNSSKPGRAKSCALVVHSTNAWADAHLDDDRDAILSKMLSEASRVTSQDLAVARHAEIHRWRFANIDKQSGPNFFLDADMGLAACGDWFIRGRIEASFRSAHTVAKEIESGL
ncbi:MAG: NAD(P)/FAD-dependent oxidoreductase, partial [Woeseiaceae bacterium]